MNDRIQQWLEIQAVAEKIALERAGDYCLGGYNVDETSIDWNLHCYGEWIETIEITFAEIEARREAERAANTLNKGIDSGRIDQGT